MKTKVAANLFRGIEAVGGHLYFEENEMVFKSHAVNIQTGETHIPYVNISDIKKCNTLGIVPNGILVTTRDGMKYKFVVWGRNGILSFINDRRHALQ